MSSVSFGSWVDHIAGSGLTAQAPGSELRLATNRVSASAGPKPRALSPARHRSIAMTSCTSTDGTVTTSTPLSSGATRRGAWSPAVSSCTLRARVAGGQPDAHAQRPDRDDLAQRPLHHHRVGQVDEVHGHRLALPPDGDVEHARALDLDRRRLVGRPRTALRSSRPWSTHMTSQNVRSMSHGM